MNKKIWIFQYSKDIKKNGTDKASWYVGWYDLGGKRHAESCGPGARGKNQAEKRFRRIQSELDMGVHRPESRKNWAKFREEYKENVLAGKAAGSIPIIRASLDHFERIIRPVRMEAITTQSIDTFVARRRRESGKKPKSQVSPATINKDLRHIKAALRKAHEWGYLTTVPRIHMVREPVKLPQFVTPEHFALIYSRACPLAQKPTHREPHYSPSDWWRALVVTAYMTGLRIKEILSIRNHDVDLTGGQMITRWDDNKGKRDELVPLHPVMIEHLRKIMGHSTIVFQWNHNDRDLWDEFARIQREVEISLPCSERHEHTPSCHVYGFHDFRRAYATANAPRMKPEVLQKLMRHKSYQTTLGYVNLTNQLQEAVDSMPIPDVLKPADPAE